MSTASITRLPSELILQVAFHCDAIAALNLSSTCKYLRASCNHALIFKEIVLRSQVEHWPQSTLAVEILQQRCGDQVSSWARFAVADQRAYELSDVQDDTVHLASTLQWSQALLAVKHPYILHPGWTGSKHIAENLSTNSAWCTAAAVLASDHLSTQLRTDMKALPNLNNHEQDTIYGYLRGFCWTVLEIRAMRHSNRNGMGYGANTLYVDPPGLSDLDLLAGRSYMALPLPFPRELNNWDLWNKEDTQSLLDHLTAGVWQGYYIHHEGHFGFHNGLDPAMQGIKFRHTTYEETEDPPMFSIIAEGCRDGVGGFRINGIIWRSTLGEVSFTGYKGYYVGNDQTRIDLRWDWSLKLTSFGLIGYWGTIADGRLQRKGSVWLWKNSR